MARIYTEQKQYTCIRKFMFTMVQSNQKINCSDFQKFIMPKTVAKFTFNADRRSIVFVINADANFQLC